MPQRVRGHDCRGGPVEPRCEVTDLQQVKSASSRPGASGATAHVSLGLESRILSSSPRALDARECGRLAVLTDDRWMIARARV
jgi:hypothetical protein